MGGYYAFFCGCDDYPFEMLSISQSKVRLELIIKNDLKQYGNILFYSGLLFDLCDYNLA